MTNKFRKLRALAVVILLLLFIVFLCRKCFMNLQRSAENGTYEGELHPARNSLNSRISIQTSDIESPNKAMVNYLRETYMNYAKSAAEVQSSCSEELVPLNDLITLQPGMSVMVSNPEMIGPWEVSRSLSFGDEKVEALSVFASCLDCDKFPVDLSGFVRDISTEARSVRVQKYSFESRDSNYDVAYLLDMHDSNMQILMARSNFNTGGRYKLLVKMDRQSKALSLGGPPHEVLVEELPVDSVLLHDMFE